MVVGVGGRESTQTEGGNREGGEERKGKKGGVRGREREGWGEREIDRD